MYVFKILRCLDKIGGDWRGILLFYEEIRSKGKPLRLKKLLYFQAWTLQL